MGCIKRAFFFSFRNPLLILTVLKKYLIPGMVAAAVLTIATVFVLNPGLLGELKQEVKEIKDEFRAEIPRFAYGIQVNDLDLCTDVIRPNQNLSEILMPAGIPMTIIHTLAEKSRDIFDVRKLKAGNPYCLLKSREENGQHYFIYEQDPIHYVVFAMGDSINIYKGEKEVVTRERTASGVIHSSLWQTLSNNNLDPSLAIRLSEIFAWSIDFYRIQSGDYFKVVYEENFVEGSPVGIGEIKGVNFNHGGRDFWAIAYEQDGAKNYFDENGMSLRKAFLKAPLEFRRISSGFTNKRFHPILKRNTAHLGTDYAAATGTPIWAVGDGTVLEAQYNGGKGNYVKIRHNGTYTTQYLHMSKFGPGIKAGVSVRQGDVIGYVGSTGLSTGPHLHYELIKNGQHVDATREEMPPGDPVKEELRAQYLSHKEKLVKQLNDLPIVDPATQAGDNEESI